MFSKQENFDLMSYNLITFQEEVIMFVLLYLMIIHTILLNYAKVKYGPLLFLVRPYNLKRFIELLHLISKISYYDQFY